jgi:hypothetical protein
MSVISELLRIEKRCRAVQDIDDNMFKIRAKGGISIIQINRFLGEADDVDGMAPVTLNNFSTFQMMNNDTERIDELDWSQECIDDVMLCGICSDDTNVTVQGTMKKESVDDVIARILNFKSLTPTTKTKTETNTETVAELESGTGTGTGTEMHNLFESLLLSNDLLQLARRTFYEGQVRRTMTVNSIVVSHMLLSHFFDISSTAFIFFLLTFS